jgi:hypothetical protein
LFDREIQSWIERHQLCKQLNIKPFKDADSYDEIPVFWADFVRIFENELIECQKEAQRRK